jgi:hypothetical protein
MGHAPGWSLTTPSHIGQKYLADWDGFAAASS